MDLQAVKEKVKDKIALGMGGSYELFFDMLYHMRLLKYVRPDHIKLINKRFEKICSLNKLREFCDLGILENPQGDVFTVPDSAVKILKEAGKNIKLLPEEVKGYGGINELNNTDVFITALKLSNYYALLYPQFPKVGPYIRPDALLVLKEEKRYRLFFLEIQKLDWEQNLEDKRRNYLRLSGDDLVFKYWLNMCDKNLLNLPIPKIDDFKFSVILVCSKKLDWGEGFIFTDSLLKIL